MEYNKKRTLLLSLLKVLQVEFFGFFVMLFFWAIAKAMGLFANILFGFTGLMCIVCIMADFAMKQGDKAKDRAKLHGDDVNENFGLAIGAAAMIPSYITMLILVLSKLGIIGNFLPAYKILNACCFPILDIMAHSADVSDMSPLVFIFTALFPLLYLFSCYIGFKLSFNQVDVKDKIVYKH